MPSSLQGDVSTSYQGSSATVMDLDQSKQADYDVSSNSAKSIPTAQEGEVKALKKVDKHSMAYVIRTGIAGGLAGCAVCSSTPSNSFLLTFVQGKTIVGPLDRVKILFQASNPQFAKYSGSWFGLISAMRDINKQDGMRGLFRGHSATLLRIFPYAGIKFLAYEQIRAVLIRDQSQETPLRRLLSGSLAGVTSVFFTYPLEIIRVRLAFETKHDSRAGLRRICDQIYHERPPLSSSSSMGSASFQAATETIEKVVPRSGLINFYRGFTPTVLGMLPYAGISFLTHDTVGDWLRHPNLVQWTTVSPPHSASPTTRSRLTNAAELTSGALAGLVGQTASYPLEVIRRRMQVGGAVGDGKMLGVYETAARIWAERGAGGFFVGLGIGYLKVVPMAAVSFLVYERSKLWLGI